MDYYDVLGVSRNCEPEVLEAAYRALMKKYHPDRLTGESSSVSSRAQLINEAYTVLRDPHRRRAYDKSRPGRRPAATSTSHAQRRAPAKAASSRPPRAQPQRRRGRPRERWARKAVGSNRVMVAIASGLGLGVLAFAGFALPNSDEGRFTETQTLTLPPVRAASLGGGREQTFCVMNKTMRRVEYTLYWGDTNGRQYALRPGYYMIHTSGISAAPVIEFFDTDRGGPARSILRPRLSSGNDETCDPNYSFEYKDADVARWSQYDRFGLFRDAPARKQPPAEPDPPAVSNSARS